MTFVCEQCAEGLGPEEIDAEASYPDEQLGGTDPATGGHLCVGCVDDDLTDEELTKELTSYGVTPEMTRERVSQLKAGLGLPDWRRNLRCGLAKRYTCAPPTASG